MFVRFVIPKIDSQSGCPMGLFSAVSLLMEELERDSYEAELIRSNLEWFGKHLPVPKKFASSYAAKRGRPYQGVCWYWDSAKECIGRMEEFVVVLKEHGYFVNRLATRMPGQIVYRDDYQVVAETAR